MKCIEIPEDTINKHTFIPEKYTNSKITESLCHLNPKLLPLSLPIRKIDSTLSRFRKNTEISLPTIFLTAMASS